MSMSTDKESDIATETKEDVQEPSKYNVVVHNNDFTCYEEVILILSQAFEMSHDEALDVASKVDTQGRGICGMYSKEIADMKLMQVNMIKKQMIQMMPGRAQEISMLKFTVEKA
ncbi:ATP-dependent Clp protease adaptor ClpS [Candidatus Pacearchaeota archaeon]|nr:ATP-dependent Clp protease adaptor ClpS [Candidatus Pacearchaeota archaeon]